MEYSVVLCQPGCAGGCPTVVVSPYGATIGEADNQIELSPGQWNLLVEKVKSGELGEIRSAVSDDCECGEGEVEEPAYSVNLDER